MHWVRRYLDLAVLIVCAMPLLASCGRSSSTADNSPQTIVRGDPIVSTAIADSPPKQTIPILPSNSNSPVMPPAQSSQQAAETVKAPGAYMTVGFDKLASYNFEVDDTPFTNQPAGDKANDQIPARVKAFDQKKVSITGFMLPLKVASGEVTEFLIMKDQSLCCYGSVPKITEWVSVKTSGRGVKPIMDQPVSMLGTLHVGATRENGYLIGIYQMDGDRLIPPAN